MYFVCGTLKGFAIVVGNQTTSYQNFSTVYFNKKDENRKKGKTVECFSSNTYDEKPQTQIRITNITSSKNVKTGKNENWNMICQVLFEYVTFC